MKTKIGFFLGGGLLLGALFFLLLGNPSTRAQLENNTETNDSLPSTEEKQSEPDLESDASYQKFLDADHPFNDLKYRPSDLTAIESDFTANNARKFQLRKEVGIQFADLAWHFRDHFKGKKRLSITSAYRSFAHQEQLLKSYCKKKNQCANAGSSEHQAGLALDLGTNRGKLDKASLERLQENAHKRGFHQSYQKGVEVDKTMVEPWHWRYVGEALATELYEKKLSFTEWFYSQGTIDNL